MDIRGRISESILLSLSLSLSSSPLRPRSVFVRAAGRRYRLAPIALPVFVERAETSQLVVDETLLRHYRENVE